MISNLGGRSRPRGGEGEVDLRSRPRGGEGGVDQEEGREELTERRGGRK